jgi:RNA polymerase sigma factor (sigma-70 family)
VIEADAESLRREEATQAAARILVEHGDFLRTVIRFQTHDPRREDDLLQEFFLQLVEQPVPPGVRNLRSYLYQMIVRDIMDLARRQEEYRRHLKKYARKIRISIYNRPSTNAIQEETEEKNSVFARLIRQLQHREAQVVTLRYRDNYSIAEIADQMGVHRRTVSRYLTSGLRKLRVAVAVE